MPDKFKVTLLQASMKNNYVKKYVRYSSASTVPAAMLLCQWLGDIFDVCYIFYVISNI